jgi:hypothetical protein
MDAAYRNESKGLPWVKSCNAGPLRRVSGIPTSSRREDTRCVVFLPESESEEHGDLVGTVLIGVRLPHSGVPSIEHG